MAVEIKRETKKVYVTGGSSKFVLIPADMAEIAGLDENAEVVVSLQHGKYGYFIAIWRKKNQPKMREIE